MQAPVQITIGEAERILSQDAPTVLDARDADSYRAGHIDGAMLLHDGLMEAIVNRRQYDTPILIYCFRGNVSLDKARLFSATGFRRVYSLAGGYVAWMKRANLPDGGVK